MAGDTTSSDLFPAHARADGAPQTAPFHVPFPRNKGFLGREDDLAKLHDLLQKGLTVGVRPAALTGMGGIGKTQLAVEYAFAHAPSYPGGVYWLEAAGDDWRPALAALAVKLDLEAKDAPEGERQLRLVAALEAYLKARPKALVVFDNVDDTADMERDRAAGFVPVNLGCRLLFTTRRRRDEGDRFGSIEVSVLPEETALALLLSGARRKGTLARGNAAEVGAARAICRVLGTLPLALVLAAAYLDLYGEEDGVSLEGYLGLLEAEGALPATGASAGETEAEAAAREQATRPTRHTLGVGATLEVQWRGLRSEEARLVLKAAALLGEAAMIPRARLALLTGLGEKGKPGRPAALTRALRELDGLSLVEELTQAGIRLHPLVREFAGRQVGGREAFAAACGDRVGEALGDMGRLHEEVAGRGIDAVLGDLRVGEALAGAAGRERIEGLIPPLDRESHALRRWDAAKEPGFLLQQLRNRCFEMGIEEVREQAEVELDEQGWAWLRERVRTSRESDALVRTLEGHTEMVSAVAVTANGRFAISASADTTLKVWDLGTGQVVRTLEGHATMVCGVAVTEDGRFAVSASADATLKVWDLGTGQAIRTLEGHTDCVTGVAVTANGRFAISASADTTLRVWDLGTGQAIRTLEGHTGRVTGVAVTGDGRFAVSASMDKTLKVWDFDTGQAVQNLEGHVSGVNDVAVTSDGRWAVSASQDKTLKVWNLDAGQTVCTLEGHTFHVTGVALTGDGRFAISASWDDRALKVWDLGTGRAVGALEGHTGWVNGVALTGDGRFAVSASWDCTLKVWDLGAGQAVRIPDGHADRMRGLVVMADARFAVSASDDKTLKVWELSTGQALRTIEGHASGVSSVAVMANDRLALSASLDKTLRVWDLYTRQAVRILYGHTAAVMGVAVTGDGRLAVSASLDKTLRVWNLDTGQHFRTLKGHTKGVRGVVVAADGLFAVSASEDKTLKVWDLDTGQHLRTLKGHAKAVTGVALTADGRFAVSASEDKTLRVWNLDTGHAVRTLEGHASAVRSVTLAVDGRFAVSASDDYTLKVWDFGTGQLLMTLETHAPLWCCAMMPDGRTLLAGDRAGVLHILDWLDPQRHGPSLANPHISPPPPRLRSAGPTPMPAPTLSPVTLSTPADHKGKVDFAILTIRDDEYQAVLDRFPPFTRAKGRRVYNLHRLDLPLSTGGGSYLVAVLRCIEQGNAEALDAARDVLEELAPRWLLVVGIAGGVPSDELTLGDVVVSTRIVDFSVEAVLQDKPSEFALMGGPVAKEAAVILADLRALAGELEGWNHASSIGAPRPPIEIDGGEFYGDEAWQKKTRAGLARQAARTEPIVSAGAVGSSDRLVKDTRILATFLLKAARQVLAVEMESAGVYRAATGRGVVYVAIRGLSDVVGFKRDPGWTAYACHSAAAFTRAFLRSRPIEPRASEARLPTVAGKPPPPELRWGAKLSGAEHKELSEALLSAFPSRNALAQMLRFGLDKSLDEIAAPGNLRDTVFDVITTAEAGGFTGALFEAAIAAAPGNPELLAIAARRRS